MLRRSFSKVRPSSMKGLTLIEIMITIILVGIIGSLTVSMDSLVQSFRMDFYNQRVFSSMVLTRSEAIKRVENVSMCRSQNGISCDTSDNNWKIELYLSLKSNVGFSFNDSGSQQGCHCMYVTGAKVKLFSNLAVGNIDTHQI